MICITGDPVNRVLFKNAAARRNQKRRSKRKPITMKGVAKKRGLIDHRAGDPASRGALLAGKQGQPLGRGGPQDEPRPEDKLQEPVPSWRGQSTDEYPNNEA